MSSPRKICVVTGSRAEFGLLHWVMHEIKNRAESELQILATGMHFAEKFGATYREIETAGFKIDAKVEMLEADNTPAAVSRSTGQGIIGCTDALHRLNPDLLVVLGDRFETFAAAVAATFLRIPVAHFHGGETTEGAFDESLRHSITKMSHFHFTATETYRRRVIQMGESPDRVFNIGAVGLDNVAQCERLNRTELEQQLGIEFRPQNVLVTFHPVTLEQETGAKQFDELTAALDQISDLGVIITHPNADPGGDQIAARIKEFVHRNPDRVWSFASLGFVRYLSMLNEVDAVIGNSSSGLIEVPHFKIGTVNIGDRQRGRIAGASVIQCDPVATQILQATQRALSTEFRLSIQSENNPYGEPGGSRRAVQILADASLTEIIKKRFHDLPSSEMEPRRRNGPNG